MSKPLVSVNEKGSLKSYISGFLASIALTLAAYFLVEQKIMTSWILISSIVGLACLQVYIQLFFFLHLGEESKPRWNLLIFLFTLLILAIIVAGTLWIMNNLDERTMPTMKFEDNMAPQNYLNHRGESLYD